MVFEAPDYRDSQLIKQRQTKMLPNSLLGVVLWTSPLLGAAHAAGLLVPPRDTHRLKASYDYVIVGAGTSGLTVADRLSADGKCELS